MPASDDRFLSRPQDAARDQLQDEAVAIENNGVAGVVPAGIARRVIKRRGQVVDDLAFSFVAPLRAHHGYCFGSGLLGHSQHPSTRKRPHLARSSSILKRYRRAYTANANSKSYAAPALKTSVPA